MRSFLSGASGFALSPAWINLLEDALVEVTKGLAQMIKKITLIGCLLVAPSMASAQNSGSMDDQIACTPDVYRLCSTQIPNEDAIVACLERNKATLSPECRKVFSKPDPRAKTNKSDEDN